MKSKIQTLLILVLISFATACKEDVKEQEFSQKNTEFIYDFEGDSIWIKTYRNIHNGLMAPKLRDVLTEIAHNNNYDSDEVSFFNLLIQNADCDSLTISDFSIKYPFAKKLHIVKKYKEMIDLGILQKNESFYYSLTKKGRELSKDIELLIRSQEIDNEAQVDELVEILSKISKNARDQKFTGFNWSLKNRERATVRFEDDSLVFPRLVTAVRDMVALINDQAHYGLYFLNGKYNYLNITREENELLGSAWWNSELNPDSFLTRPTWGYDLEETNSFIESLISKNLLKLQDSLIIPTNLGKEIIDEASKHTEKHFFEPWNRLTPDEVETLVTYLNKENEN